MEKMRNNRVDNIKALLIFLVVFAHNMEPLYKGSIRFLYLFIYLFHMPLFILCTGYFAKFSVERVKDRIIYPYVIFQMAYLLFEVFYYKESDYPLTVFSPYWILWYLFSFFFWMLLLPFIEPICQRRKKALGLVLLSVFIGVVIGFDEQIGMDFSLSRTIVFLPYFLIGYIMRRYEEIDLLKREYHKNEKRRMLVLFGGILLIYILIHRFLRPKAVYGAYPYHSCGIDWYMRLLLYAMGFLISICIIVWMPKKRTIFSYLGQNSMQIFLLHGFLIKIFRKIDVYQFLKGEVIQWIFLVVSTAVLVLVLGSNWMKKIMTPFMEYPRKKGGKTDAKVKKIR